MDINKKRTLFILCMAALCLVLYTIVLSRVNSKTDVIFGGADGAYVRSDSVSFVNPDEVETPEPTVDIWPKIDITMTQYSVVNMSNLLTESYQPDVSEIPGTYMLFDSAALPHLVDLMDALKEEGFSVYVGGSYRTYSYQKHLFDGKATQIALGMGIPESDKMFLDPKYQEAVEEAKTITMFPGSSEHQLGLAVDLFDRAYSKLIYENMNQSFYEWLDAHCAEYGFIKRYPTRKLLLTGWDEPWHYRYVGVEAATFIMENNLCLEEFYAHYDPEFTY